MFKGRHVDRSVILLCVRWDSPAISACVICKR